MSSDKLGYPYTKPRVPIGAMITGPGPIYKLPPLVGEIGHDFQSTHIKAPGYSFGHRTKVIQAECSPGPAAYAQDAKVTTHGISVGPSYSLKQRLDKSATTSGPGPARYLPNDDTIHPRSPGFQFGLRPPILNKNPAPGESIFGMTLQTIAWRGYEVLPCSKYGGLLFRLKNEWAWITVASNLNKFKVPLLYRVKFFPDSDNWKLASIYLIGCKVGTI